MAKKQKNDYENLRIGIIAKGNNISDIL